MRQNKIASIIEQAVEEALSRNKTEKYLLLMKLIVSIYESSSTIPLCIHFIDIWKVVVFRLYLRDACSRRLWADEKEYKDFFNRLISVFKSDITFFFSFLVSPPNEYSEEEINSILNLAVDYVKPIINSPLDKVLCSLIFIFLVDYGGNCYDFMYVECHSSISTYRCSPYFGMSLFFFVLCLMD